MRHLISAAISSNVTICY